MCLGQEDAADLRTPLRASEGNDLLDAAIEEAIARKPKGHDFIIDRRHQRPALVPAYERDRGLRRWLTSANKTRSLCSPRRSSASIVVPSIVRFTN